MVNLLLKTNRGRDIRPNFIFFSLECFNCQWVSGGGLRQKVLFRAGWNLIFCVPSLIQGWRQRVNLRCHLFVSDMNQGNEDFRCKKVGSRFSCVAPRTKRFSLNLPLIYLFIYLFIYLVISFFIYIFVFWGLGVGPVALLCSIWIFTISSFGSFK